MATQTLELEHREEELPRFMHALDSLLEEAHAPMKPQHTLAVVMEEVVLNVIRYAIPSEREPLTVAMTAEPGHFQASVRDRGQPFNPLDREEPDVTLDLDSRPIGGLGILMTKKLMSSVDYKREDGCNLLTLELVW